MKKRTHFHTRHLISSMARLGAAALVIAGLTPFAAFGASCKNESNVREETELYDPALKVTIRARAADANDGWKVLTRDYFTKDGESSDYDSPVKSQTTSISLGTENSHLWGNKKLAVFNDQRTDKTKSTFNLFRVALTAGNGTNVGCDVTLRGVDKGDVRKAQFISATCTADGSAIEDLDNNAYVSCVRSFKNGANRFEVNLTLKDQN